MIKTRSSTWLDEEGIRRAVEESTVDPLEQCALIVETEAKVLTSKGGKIKLLGRSPRRGAKTLKRGAPSKPGTPPHRQSGVMSGSIRYAKNGRTFIIGPTSPPASYGALHEFGGRHHPPRPFMWPSLVRSMPRFPRKFRNLPLKHTRAGRATEQSVNRWVKRWGRRVK